MEIEQTHINQIKIAFEKMQTSKDLLQLMNEVKPLIYGDKTVLFELKQLTWYANPKLAKKRYTEFKVKKKSGAERSIHAPVSGLKAIQKTLSLILQCVYEPHQAAMGFVKDKSIVDNANLHVGNKYVYNIDLKDFFSSVDQARVWKCLQLKPFNLTDTNMNSEEKNPVKIDTGIRKFVTEFKEEIFYTIKDSTVVLVDDKKGNYKKYKNRLINGLEKSDQSIKNHGEQTNNMIFDDAKRYILSDDNLKALNRLITSRKNLANMIASICCTEMEVERKNGAGEWEKVNRNVLPQGAPTSPIITNVVCQRLDYLLSAVAKRFGLKYSRYADDITFSSMHNVYQSESDFINELHRIIAEQGFHIKESKTRLQKEGYRKEVTGLLVNDKVNVHKRYIKQLRMWLYYWETYGYERAYSFFLQQYLADKGNTVKGKPDMVNVIGGKLDYLKMVKGTENELYLKLRERYNKLTSKYNFIETIINVWENEGIEKAMNLYYLKNSNSDNQVIDDINFDEMFFNDSDEFDEIL